MKTAIVTGGSRGIGFGVAKQLGSEGYNIAILDINAARDYQDNLNSLTAMGVDCHYQQGSITSKTDRESFVDAVTAKWGDIDVLVNNAGGAHGLDTAMDASLDDWETMIDVNVKGLLYCTKAVVNEMAERGSGHIVNIGSVASFTAYAGANVYGGAKAFVAQFSRNLRSDLHGTGVRVTDIQPGLLESEFSLVRLKGDTAKAEAVYAGCEPLTPEDLADVIHYVTTLPRHINIGLLRITPTCQSETGNLIYKGPGR